MEVVRRVGEGVQLVGVSAAFTPVVLACTIANVVEICPGVRILDIGASSAVPTARVIMMAAASTATAASATV